MDPEERINRIKDVIHRIQEMQDRVMARGRRDAVDANSRPYTPDHADEHIQEALDELFAAMDHLQGNTPDHEPDNPYEVLFRRPEPEPEPDPVKGRK